MPLVVSSQQNSSLQGARGASAQAPSSASAVPDANGRPQPASRADPRQLSALSQALSSFLAEINGGHTSQGAGVEQALDAYANQGGAAQATVSGPGLVDGKADTARDLSSLRQSFSRLAGKLEATLSGQTGEADAVGGRLRLKADVSDFINTLMKVTDAVDREAPVRHEAGAARADRLPVALAAAEEPMAEKEPAATGNPTDTGPVDTYAPENFGAPRPETSKPSLFAQLSEKLHRHFEDL